MMETVDFEVDIFSIFIKFLLSMWQMYVLILLRNYSNYFLLLSLLIFFIKNMLHFINLVSG